MIQKFVALAFLLSFIGIAGCGSGASEGDVVADENEIAKYVAENPDSSPDSTDMPEEFNADMPEEFNADMPEE